MHLAAALVAFNDRFDGRLDWLLLLHQPTPTQIEPDQHLYPLEFQFAIWRIPTVVAQTLRLARQRVLQKAAEEFNSRYCGSQTFELFANHFWATRLARFDRQSSQAQPASSPKSVLLWHDAAP